MKTYIRELKDGKWFTWLPTDNGWEKYYSPWRGWNWAVKPGSLWSNPPIRFNPEVTSIWKDTIMWLRGKKPYLVKVVEVYTGEGNARYRVTPLFKGRGPLLAMCSAKEMQAL